MGILQHLLLGICLGLYFHMALTWENNWDGQLWFTCRDNQAIDQIFSSHSDHYEDRRYSMQCGDAVSNRGVSYSCAWSGCSDCNCVGNLTSESGVFKINVTGKPTTVYCEMKDGYNWMVIFRRTIGDVPFNNVWSSYENGFGNKDGDHWIGLSIINHFTSSGWSRLRIEMEDVLSYVGYVQYSTFLVGGASEEYKLTLSGYSGTAGFDAFSYHNNMKFSTKDNDNDESATTNCALEYGHPWWNRDCTRLKFTKDDFNNLGWYNWYTGSYEQLTKITMIIQNQVN